MIPVLYKIRLLQEMKEQCSQNTTKKKGSKGKYRSEIVGTDKYNE